MVRQEESVCEESGKRKEKREVKKERKEKQTEYKQCGRRNDEKSATPAILAET